MGGSHERSEPDLGAIASMKCSGPLPLVSVVIPTHNRAEVIGRAVDSVLQQTYPRIEIVVVDDRSTDATQAVLQEIRAPSLKILKTTNSRGAAAARNLGISRSSGDLIAFLDSDDAWESRKIELQVACFRNGPPDLGAVYTKVTAHHSDGSVTQRVPQHRGRIFDVLQWRNKVGGASSVMVHRSVFDDVGLFDIRLPACEDWDLWARIARKYRFDFIDSCCVHYYTDRDDRLTRRSRAVFIAHHLIFRRLNGRRPAVRNLSMYLAIQSRELYWLGKHRLAMKLAIRSLWLRPLLRERYALHTLRWLFQSRVQIRLGLR